MERFFKWMSLIFLCLWGSNRAFAVEAPRLVIGDDYSLSEGVEVIYLIKGILIISPFILLAAVWIYFLRRQVDLKTKDLRRELVRSELAEKEVTRLNEELRRSQSEIAFTLGEVIENRSHETANHVRRVAAMTEYLANLAGLGGERSKNIALASSMHDIGKIGISDKILNKPGRLSHSEFEIVKTHTTIGYEILSQAGGSLFKIAALIAYEHHEWWNGRGYPRGLVGENISLEARIVAIADVFDALSHPRVYKEAWPMSEVLATMTLERGTHFDPDLLDLFIRNIRGFIGICESMPDEKNEKSFNSAHSA